MEERILRRSLRCTPGTSSQHVRDAQGEDGIAEKLETSLSGLASRTALCKREPDLMMQDKSVSSFSAMPSYLCITTCW